MQTELVVLGVIACWVQVYLTTLAGLGPSRRAVRAVGDATSTPQATPTPDDIVHVCHCTVECKPEKPLLDLPVAIAVGIALGFVFFVLGFLCGSCRSRAGPQQLQVADASPGSPPRPRGKGVLSVVL